MGIQYRRGYNAGLPGFLAIVFVGLIIYFFKPIYQFLDHIGFNSFLENVGIIHPTDGGLTLWRLFAAGFVIVLLITLALVVLILLAAFLPFLEYLLVPFIWVLAAPILLFGSWWYKVRRPKHIRYCLFTGFHEGKSREVSLDEAAEVLDRFPNHDEHFCYLALTKDYDVYWLVARPRGMDLYFGESNYNFWGVRLTYPKEVDIFSPIPSYAGGCPRHIYSKDILFIVENRTEPFLKLYEFLVKEKYVMIGYVLGTKQEYERQKMELLQELALDIEYEKTSKLKMHKTDINGIIQKLNRLTEVERRESPTIFKEGWVYGGIRKDAISTQNSEGL